MQLRRSTQQERATVTQEFRRILQREDGAPRGAMRRVQLLVPESPGVVTVITPDCRLGDGANVARELGPNRTYKGMPAPPNTTMRFTLAADQELWAAATIRFAVLGLIIEYVQ